MPNLENPDVSRVVGGMLGRWIPFPSKKKTRGDAPGTPERLLDDMLANRIKGKQTRGAGNDRTWKVRFATTKSPLVLLQKHPTFGGDATLRGLAAACGSKRGGETRFCHTVWKSSRRGFCVTVDDDNVSITNASFPELAPSWSWADVEKHVRAEADRLILVFGVTREGQGGRSIKFTVAIDHSGFLPNEFRRGLAEGWISVVFDVRINGRGALGGRETMFKIRPQDVGLVYGTVSRIRAGGRAAAG